MCTIGQSPSRYRHMAGVFFDHLSHVGEEIANPRRLSGWVGIAVEGADDLARCIAETNVMFQSSFSCFRASYSAFRRIRSSSDFCCVSRCSLNHSATVSSTADRSSSSLEPATASSTALPSFSTLRASMRLLTSRFLSRSDRSRSSVAERSLSLSAASATASSKLPGVLYAQVCRRILSTVTRRSPARSNNSLATCSDRAAIRSFCCASVRLRSFADAIAFGKSVAILSIRTDRFHRSSNWASITRPIRHSLRIASDRVAMRLANRQSSIANISSSDIMIGTRFSRGFTIQTPVTFRRN